MGNKRFYVERDIEAFCRDKIQKTNPEYGQSGGYEEYAMLRLRLTEGLSLAEYEKRGGTAETVLQNIKKLPKNLVTLKNGIVSLTPEGFLVSNSVIGALIE